jgi:hypothetical protein
LILCAGCTKQLLICLQLWIFRWTTFTVTYATASLKLVRYVEMTHYKSWMYV